MCGRCLCLSACCLLRQQTWVETAQAGRARAGLSVGFREVRDGAGQVREQISARRMECELARPEGDSVWYGGTGSGSRQNVCRWRVCEARQLAMICASEVQAGTRFRFEGGRQ